MITTDGTDQISPLGPAIRAFGDICTPLDDIKWTPYLNDKTWIGSAGAAWSTYKDIAMSDTYKSTSDYTDLLAHD